LFGGSGDVRLRSGGQGPETGDTGFSERTAEPNAARGRLTIPASAKCRKANVVRVPVPMFHPVIPSRKTFPGTSRGQLQALKRGRWISQPSRHAGRRLSDAGQHPARSGPRALSATHDAGPLPVAASPTPIPEALPACGPPEHPPVARKCPHLSDNVQAQEKTLTPRRRCSRGRACGCARALPC
jgi:hypothetical protein